MASHNLTHEVWYGLCNSSSRAAIHVDVQSDGAVHGVDLHCVPDEEAVVLLRPQTPTETNMAVGGSST